MNILQVDLICVLLFALALSSCSSGDQSPKHKEMSAPAYADGTFGYDLNFLKKYTDVLVLSSKDSLGKIIVTPKMQGRVMTSTAQADNGKSLGWVNHALIASGKTKPHFSPYGGEDRFWIGPEGGQYSIFIKPGTKMVFDNWYVPKAFNTDPWKLASHSDSRVQVTKQMELGNYSGITFNIDVKRTIKLFEPDQIEQMLEVKIPSGVNPVGYESENMITNAGDKAWTKQTGAISIWILSQFNPAPGVTVAIPYKQGTKEKMGPVVTTAYFGDISDERLKVDNGIIYFKMDGKKRRKLGLSPRRSKGVEGSYDATNHILTVMQYNQSDSRDYMNQLWEHQKHPYAGNVEFAYNDGPLEDGSQLGPFFEMESSSPAAFLSPGDSITHNHRVFHFSGNEQALSRISEKVLGVNIKQIKSAFSTKEAAQ